MGREHRIDASSPVRRWLQVVARIAPSPPTIAHIDRSMASASSRPSKRVRLGGSAQPRCKRGTAVAVWSSSAASWIRADGGRSSGGAGTGGACCSAPKAPSMDSLASPRSQSPLRAIVARAAG